MYILHIMLLLEEMQLHVVASHDSLMCTHTLAIAFSHTFQNSNTSLLCRCGQKQGTSVSCNHYYAICLQNLGTHAIFLLRNQNLTYGMHKILMIPFFFFIVEVPTIPLNVAVHQVARATDGQSVTIRVSWMRPRNFVQFDIDRYHISVSSTSSIRNTTTACGGCTNTTITVNENPSNVAPITNFTITISASSRCGEASRSATASYTLSKFMCVM